jgi:NTE family protein
MAGGSRALVLAGGGVAGIAWELGFLAGLADAGVDVVTTSDVVVGTSAGAAVGAQVTSGTPLAELEAVQLGPPSASREIPVDIDIVAFRQRLADLVAGARDPDDARARVGRMAIEAETVPEAVRREVVAARLPVHQWPEHPLVLTAVDAETGAFLTFTRDSGVDLVDAVAASCAVPGVWPPVTIGGHRYVDGGVRSFTNADVAAGHDRVLIAIPLALMDEQRAVLDEELARLAPGRAMVAEADEASVAAIGANPLDPAARGPAAKAGRAQATALAAAVAEFWS